MQKKILVHAHVYYKDLWAGLADCIKNISGYEYELHISMVDDDESFRQAVLADFPDAQFHLVENRGFDVRPFVQLIQGVRLDDYSYVVKLHTKRDTVRVKLNNLSFKGADWRVSALSIFSSPSYFRECAKYLDQHPDCGLIGARRLTVQINKCEDQVYPRFSQFIKDKGYLDCPEAKFVAGTMFMVRASLLKPLYAIQPDEFEDIVAHDGLFAHVIERFFGYMIYMQGCHIKDPRMRGMRDLCMYAEATMNGCSGFFFSAFINKRNRMRLKVMRIPLPCALSERLFPSLYKRLLSEKD